MNRPPSHAGLRAEQAMAQLAFFLLFPGFFFYHTALGIGAMGAFLGGYFSPVSILLVLPLSVLYLARVRRDPNRLAKVDMAFWLFLAYFFAVVAVNAAFGKSMQIAANHMLGILFLINIFIIFKTADFASPAFRRMGLASLVAMSAIVFAYSVNGVFYLGALGMAKDADSLATYQGFSRSYIITFVAVIACTRSAWLRLFLYGIAAPTLFLNSARSEFAALLFLIPFIELYRTRHKLLVLLTGALLLLLMQANLDLILAHLPENRILELFDLSHSSSANKRHHLSVHALQTIRAHPLLGDYASYAAGNYAHNILSAWVDTGLFGITALFVLLLAPMVPMFVDNYFSGRPAGNFLLAFSFCCITVLLLLTSHYFTDMLIGATLGAYSFYWYERKYDQHRPSHVRPSPPRHADLRQAVPQPGQSRV
jgi:hypothetical protein